MNPATTAVHTDLVYPDSVLQCYIRVLDSHSYTSPNDLCNGALELLCVTGVTFCIDKGLHENVYPKINWSLSFVARTEGQIIFPIGGAHVLIYTDAPGYN